MVVGGLGWGGGGEVGDGVGDRGGVDRRVVGVSLASDFGKSTHQFEPKA